MILLKFLLFSILASTLTYANQQPATISLDTTKISIEDRFLFSDYESLFPITLTRVGQILLILFIAGLANAGGIGGGPLLSPIFIVVLDYTESDAVEMVSALVFGGSLGNFINMVRRRDPKTQNPLIDYDMNLICMPAMLLGVVLGGSLNRVIAPIGIIVGLVAVTSYGLPKVYRKAQTEYKKETTVINERKDLVIIGSAQIRMASKVTRSQPDSTTQQPVYASQSESRIEPPINSVAEPPLFPKAKIGVVFLLMATIIMITVFRGGQHFESVLGIPYCKLGYWLLYTVNIMICLLSLIFILRSRKMSSPKEASVYQELEAEQEQQQQSELVSRHKVRLLLISFTAGIMASTLGIGGGIIMSPTLLKLGMAPQAVAATSGFFVVQTTFLSLVQSCLYGSIPLKEKAILLITVMVGSYCISFCLSYIVRKFERPSIILYVLSVILLLCLVVTPICVLLRNWNDLNQIFAFNSIC